GILMTVAADRAEGILGELHAAGVTAAGIIGEVIDGPSGTVEVVA
ncbi:MAG: selenide, water dikinase SelD, partial [Nitrospinaceae bacterium]|nr:selenide, water dikinase SelD [Nitrospinaceae bacterium]